MKELIGGKGSYIPRNESVITAPGLTVLVAEARAGFFALYFPDTEENYKKYSESMGAMNLFFVDEIPANRPGAVRHGGGAVYVFADGHCSYLRPEQIDVSGSRSEKKPGFTP